MAKNYKLIKGVETTPLKKLNEGQALKNPDKYVFQGVFTACSTPEHKIVNRNGRIYMEKEVLRHLGYLRDMIKENNGRILGELDHPEGRFDVSMKEASHMITDLWYDEQSKCVMGRIEVLDTPNGKTLKSLIDAGFPLYVSSRAAGDVNEKTKEVEIAQIFTYDVVCTPGFKEARLERVNESVLTDKALKYINESISTGKKIEVEAIEVPAKKLNEKAVAAYDKTTINDVMKPLNESNEETKEEKKEDKKEENSLNDVQNFFPTMGGNESVNEDDEESDDAAKSDDVESNDDNAEDVEKTDDEESNDAESDDEEKEELSDEEKEENRKLIISVKGFDKDGEVLGGEDVEDDEESDEKRDDIVDIDAEGNDDEEDDNVEDNEENVDGEDDANEAAESEEAANIKEKQAKIKADTDKNIEELESILDSVQKAESVKESIIRRYPFTISLSESNFAKFASLRPKLKKRCADFIEEHEIFDIRAINELWATPLREDKKMQQNWLKLASQADIDLYCAAPVDVQNAIEESAKYVVLETAEDVDLFWHRTGLRQAAAQQKMNEQKIENFKQSVVENQEFQNNNPLGYTMDFIKMTEQYFNL